MIPHRYVLYDMYGEGSYDNALPRIEITHDKLFFLRDYYYTASTKHMLSFMYIINRPTLHNSDTITTRIHVSSVVYITMTTLDTITITQLYTRTGDSTEGVYIMSHSKYKYFAFIVICLCLFLVGQEFIPLDYLQVSILV